jgi:hypothetical protein
MLERPQIPVKFFCREKSTEGIGRSNMLSAYKKGKGKNVECNDKGPKILSEIIQLRD